MFDKVLIANRGEIACRIARTCRRMGIAVATVHSAADSDALHVRDIGESVALGGALPAQSYLNVQAILAAARRTGARAIHPGIGFLSEDPEFARAVEAEGLIFIGPTAETLLGCGDKWAAKKTAAALHIPIIDGAQGASDDPRRLVDMLRDVGLPVLLKAAAGGGGRGVRMLTAADNMEHTIASAMREAEASFGRPHLLVERFLEHARHIEVQIAGDGRGQAIHLFERECSLQRRYQKVVEEAPAVELNPRLRETLLDAACRLARALRYRGLGTVEFLVQGELFYFLEANPRLQVEHPVTEAITGLDLVEWQLRIAAGEALPLQQAQVTARGHAIEARICAEDPAAGYMPSTGTLDLVAFPAEARVDSGVQSGSKVSPYYDALLAKVIAHGSDRTQALLRLRRALENTALSGVITNVPFLRALLAHPDVAEGRCHIRFIDERFAQWRPDATAPAPLLAVAATMWLWRTRDAADQDPWTRRASTGWRLTTGAAEPSTVPSFYLERGGQRHAVTFGAVGADGTLSVALDGEWLQLHIAALDDSRIHVRTDTMAWTIRVVTFPGGIELHGNFGSLICHVKPYLAEAAASVESSGHMLAPMMGRIVAVHVQVGQAVHTGDVLLVEESMKMEFRVVAPIDGVVTELACAVGDMVDRGAFVAEVQPQRSPEQGAAGN